MSKKINHQYIVLNNLATAYDMHVFSTLELLCQTPSAILLSETDTLFVLHITLHAYA